MRSVVSILRQKFRARCRLHFTDGISTEIRSNELDRSPLVLGGYYGVADNLVVFAIAGLVALSIGSLI